MIEFTANSIQIFGFQVYYYGIILMLGVAGGIGIANSEAKRKKANVAFLLDSWLLVAMVFGGVIGARLWHIFTPQPSQGITPLYYLQNLDKAINIRNGGLGIPGAVIGGILVLYWFTKKYKESFGTWLDILAPGILLGQAIGRWGNFVNQELYGAPTDVPWKIYIDPINRLSDYADVGYYHPIFAYEMIWNLASMFLLLWVAKKYAKKLKTGDIFFMYLITYPTIRILLEFLRMDSSLVGGLKVNQVIMFVVLIYGAVNLYLRHKPKKSRKKNR
jgi:phosphatidylglycerol---prolipoprotein diacylglyceryl transferase